MREVEVVFATWGMWPLTASQLDAMPKLRAVFYAAGSARHFALPLLEHGVLVVLAWAANAIPVAEWTLAHILLANKGCLRNKREYRGPQFRGTAFVGKGNYGATVSVLGAGQIGSKILELLRPFQLRAGF